MRNSNKRKPRNLVNSMNSGREHETKRYYYGSCFSFFILHKRGWARTQTPTTRNCTVELPTFAVIAGVSPVRVQWKSLALEETPLWPDLLPRQVSMVFKWEKSHSRWFRTSRLLVDPPPPPNTHTKKTPSPTGVTTHNAPLPSRRGSSCRIGIFFIASRPNGQV